MEESAPKRIRSETSAESKNDSTTQNLENSILNSYLTYDILRIVFRYLNAKDLARATMVCRHWSEAANNEKYTRSPYCFIVNYYYNDMLDYGLNLNCIKNSRIKPVIGLFFIQEHTAHKMTDILNSLPQNCEAIMLYASGTIINNNEMEDHTFRNVICAFLPQIPNVKINTFKITLSCNISERSQKCQVEEHSRTFQCQKKKLIKMLNETCIPNHEKSTCLMLFCNNAGRHMAMLLVSALQKSKEDRIASIWGGVLEDTHTHCKQPNNFYDEKEKYISKYKPYCLAILITGTIQSWSIVVDKKCKTKEQVEKKLRLFKDQVQLKQHSMGFMFACRARGINMYNERSIESTIFKTLFPKVPLVGCFGGGEFGKNTIPVDEMGKKTNSKWYNEFSTIFMILTYG